MILRPLAERPAAHWISDCQNKEPMFVSCNRIYLQQQCFISMNFYTRIIFVIFSIPTAIVLTNWSPPFSQKTVCSCPLWSPSILIASCLDFGLPNRSNTSWRAMLDSMIPPSTSLMGSRKYLQRKKCWCLLSFVYCIFTLMFGFLWFILVGVYNTFALARSKHIQLWLIFFRCSWAHFNIMKQTIAFLSWNYINFNK